MFFVNSRPGRVDCRHPILGNAARALRAGCTVRTLVRTVIERVAETKRTKNLLPNTGLHDELRKTGNAENEEAASHLGISPEQKRPDQVDTVGLTGKCDCVG